MNEPIKKAPAVVQPTVSQPGKKKTGWARWILATLVAATLLYALFLRPFLRSSEKARYGARVATVVAEPAHKASLAVRLLALGTITPVNTVTVRSRVDGQLQKLHFQEGAAVEAGAPLADIDPRPFEAQKQQAEAQLARDNALLENARADLARFTALLADNSISQQQATTQQALVRQYEAAVRVDQAQVESADLQLAYAHITAPVSGRAGLRLVDVGNMIHASDQNGIVVITQLHPISVLFSIPQESLPRIMARFKAGETISIEAFDRDGRTLLAKGQLVTIDNQIDPSTGTVKLRGEFANDDEALFPNQFVNIQLLAEEIGGATVVPTAALQKGSAGTFVYVVTEKDGQKTASVRPVESGPSERGVVSIVRGITPGDWVVTDGVDRLRDGAAVDVVSPGKTPAAPDDKAGKAGKYGGKHRRDGAPAQQN